ncbi:MAG TPA: AmmeMemoRadiSam system radical SAM enzyme, partial [Candidatus Glassbacteria bacterium]|nr:AmmeMemoRadiSam system radical SAM enzyme [Candidatus Glassbacteria bacterium]
MSYSRREFFCRGACLATLALASNVRGQSINARRPGDTIPPVEARWWQAKEAKRIECQLCPKKCRVDDLERGYCGVRENRGGKYYTHVYAAPCAVNVDPIEKKPLFHFLPGTKAFSIATAGCNMDCAFCQNWEISQVRPEQVEAWYMPPASIAKYAVRSQANSVAYTYTEPVVFAEYVYDSSVACRARGVHSVMVSNGYIQEEPLGELCKVLDAIKVDLKSFREKYYKEVCAGELQPVLDTIKRIKSAGVWLEIVYLMVPTLNDDPVELDELCGWIAENIGPDVPLHFTRFHPQYRLQHLPDTPIARLEKALEIAKRHGLHYVYAGNVPGHPSESTRCPKCGEVVVRRVGYQVLAVNISAGKCSGCATPIA